MQDVEREDHARVAMALCQSALGGKQCPCVQSGVFNCANEYPGQQATAAISAMTPDTAISHALHAGEDVGYARGWNAAIDELERQDGFGEWAEAAKFLRTLKPTR